MHMSADSSSRPRRARRAAQGAAITAVATLAVTVALATAAAAVPIGDLHQNDANGVPAAPYGLGTPVTVSGIVTVPEVTFNPSSIAVHVQDATGGIYLYEQGGVSIYDFALGDSVTVSGTIAQFRGLTELYPLSSVTVHASGHPSPEPLLLTCAQVEATFDPVTYREDHESRLVTIEGVEITGGTWPTSPGSGSVLTISDATGSTTLYINQFTELNGSPQPPTVFDVVGVIQQDDTTMPYDSGYRIVPRFLSDVSGDGPQILGGPEVVEVTPTSARIEWTTSVPASSTVELGRTMSYGVTFTDPALVTEHSVLCDPIDDATYWHYRVSSSNGEGTGVSGDDTFITPPATDEAIIIYFNRSIDPGYADGVEAHGDIPFDDILISYFDAAQHSIDAAFYSLTLSHVADALIAAHQRGVQVRVIRDYDQSATQYNRLAAAGIPIIDSHFGGNHASGGVHHNKFWVIDARDETSTLDDWVVTGSWNPSYNGTNVNAENILVIKDAEVAEAYTIEFDEMWGSETQTPDPVESRMGTEKWNNTGHSFMVNGIPVDVRFSPSDGNENVMIYWIGQSAEHQVYFSILTFLREGIEQAMRAKWDALPDFEVRGVFDDEATSSPDSRYHNMSGAGSEPWTPPADVHLGDYGSGLLHHKYMILDPGYPGLDPMVITGSTNWSTNGATRNDENQVFIHDYQIARQYLQEFAERYHAAGGSGELGSGATGIADGGAAPGTGRRLSVRNLPNPFNPYTAITFELERAAATPRIRIIDATGRQVRELTPGPLGAGRHAIAWDGTDASGHPLASGVYFYRLEAHGEAATSRMVLTR
ncbi:MAG: phospholipase D-like domain-containing protein [Candidatus Eiseniibacteriota bacterium]|jgi:phosphatidylserine/phosphatidylglycerophosphate/cardiolipin synthase-like enzyme